MDEPTATTELTATPEPQQSPTIGKLAEALAHAQAEIENAVKDHSNPFFKSKYADLASVWGACRAPLAKNGLAIVQTTTGDPDRVNIITTLAHASGEWIRGTLSLRPVKTDPQAIGSAITYGRRYALAAIAGVATEDDDGNDASQPTGKPSAKLDEAKAAGQVKSAHDGRTLKPGEPADAKPQPTATTPTAKPETKTTPEPSKPATAAPAPAKQHPAGTPRERLANVMTLSGITDGELMTLLVKKGLATDKQTIESMPDRFIEIMLDGKDKKTGRNNWEIIAEQLKPATKK